jgi:hypothetical protein
MGENDANVERFVGQYRIRIAKNSTQKTCQEFSAKFSGLSRGHTLHFTHFCQGYNRPDKVLADLRRRLEPLARASGAAGGAEGQDGWVVDLGVRPPDHIGGDQERPDDQRRQGGVTPSQTERTTRWMT